jgi:hypothetical protein
MKKILIFAALLVLSVSGVYSQQPKGKTPFIFEYQGRDTLLSRDRIHLWTKTGTFPNYLNWKNTPFSLQKSNIHGIGLFTDAQTGFSTGEDIGWAFVKVSSTGVFMNDYYESHIGMFINDSETSNVQIISTQEGLLMRAKTNIPPNTEIVVRYQDFFDLFPNDTSVKFLIQYK